MSTHPLKHFQWPEAMYHGDRAFGDRSPPLANPGVGPLEAPRQLRFAPKPHAVNTWSALQCGARAPDGRTRARGAGSPTGAFFFFPDDGTKEETGPSPRRSQAAARAPALLVCWNLPHAGARRRMGMGEKGGGEQRRRPRMASSPRHEGGARPPALRSPIRTASTAPPARPGPRPRPPAPGPQPSALPCSESPRRPLTWVTFPHGLGGEEERPLLNERLVEAVELPVHGGGGGGGGERTRLGGDGAAARQGTAKRAERRVASALGGLETRSARRGGAKGPGIYRAAPARARPGPRPSASRANAPAARGGQAGAPRPRAGPDHSAAGRGGTRTAEGTAPPARSQSVSAG